MQAKIRDAAKQKIPYILVIGDKEMEANAVAVRLRDGDRPRARSRWPSSSRCWSR